MKLIINGQSENIAGENISVAELLALKNVEAPDMVSVQLNGEFVQRAAFATGLKENDELDFLYFMGGGGGGGI
jgi:sulfur carrier protein